jgi:hypothetical protein
MRLPPRKPVLVGELNDADTVRVSEGIREHEERAGSFPRRGADRGADVVHVPDLYGLQRHAQSLAPTCVIL